MGKKQWKTVAVSVVTLALLSLLVFWGFRDHYQAILLNIRAVSIPELLLLLGMGAAAQLLEAAVCVTLVRRRLPRFSFCQAVEVVFLGVFGNVSTFSAGSIPIRSYYLHRCGLIAGAGAGTMILEYVFHKCSVLGYATVMLLLPGRRLTGVDRGISRCLLPGYGICALIIAVLLLLCTSSRVQSLVSRGIDRLPDTKKRRERKRMWKENLAALYTESQQLLRDGRCSVKALI